MEKPKREKGSNSKLNRKSSILLLKPVMKNLGKKFGKRQV